jgi:hypothetical protein
LAAELMVHPDTIHIGSYSANNFSCYVRIYHSKGVCSSSVTGFYKDTKVVKSITGCNPLLN